MHNRAQRAARRQRVRELREVRRRGQFRPRKRNLDFCRTSKAAQKVIDHVLVDQILAWHNSLFHEELGLLPDGLIEQVTAALEDFLDI